MLQENTAESCSSLMFLHLQTHKKWFYCYHWSAFRLLSVVSYSLGTISIYIRSSTTSPATFIITAQDLLQLAECVCFLLWSPSAAIKKTNSPPRTRMPRLQTGFTEHCLLSFHHGWTPPWMRSISAASGAVPCERRSPDSDIAALSRQGAGRRGSSGLLLLGRALPCCTPLRTKGNCLGFHLLSEYQTWMLSKQSWSSSWTGKPL